MKLRDFLTKTERIAADGDKGPLVFDKGVPRGPFKRLAMTVIPDADDGTHDGLAGDAIVEYIAKLNNDEIWNLTPAQLRAILEAFLGPIGGTVPAAKALRYTFPFDAYVETGLLGLPDKGAVTFEIGLDPANTKKGDWRLSYEFWDKAQPPSGFLKMLREPMLAPKNSGGFPYYINTGAGKNVLGFVLPLVPNGISEIWLYRSPKDGAPAEEMLHFASQEEILESQAHYNPESITNPFFWKPFPTPMDYPEKSYIKVVTGAGTDESDEIVPVIIHPA